MLFSKQTVGLHINAYTKITQNYKLYETVHKAKRHKLDTLALWSFRNYSKLPFSHIYYSIFNLKHELFTSLMVRLDKNG